MAHLINLGNPIHLMPFSNTNGFTAGSATIDATGERVGFVFNVPKDGTLDKFECGIRALTLAGSSSLRAGFMDVTTGSIPDDTFDQFRDFSTGPSANSWWAGPGLMTSDGTDGGTKRTVTEGQTIAAVISFETRAGSDSLVIGTIAANVIGFTSHPPHLVNNLSGWQVGSQATTPCFALKYSDGSYEVPAGCCPFYATNAGSAYANNTSVRERGCRWTPEFDVLITSIFTRGDFDGPADIVLYQNTTQIASFSTNQAIRIGTGATGTNYPIPSGGWELTAGTLYRIMVKPTSTTTITLGDNDIGGSSGLLAGFYGNGAFYYSSRDSGGTFTDDPVKWPYLCPNAGAFVASEGGGGSGSVGNFFPGGNVTF